MAYLVNFAVFLSLMKHDKIVFSTMFDFDLQGKIHTLEYPMAA
jgi:hypothetical protein